VIRQIRLTTLYAFECPRCGNQVFVVDGNVRTSVICQKCGVWMRWTNIIERKIREGIAGDKAFYEVMEGF